MSDQIQMYSTSGVYLEGWYTMEDVRQVLETMQKMTEAAQQSANPSQPPG